MLLVADIGNSSTVLGLWAEGSRIVHRWRVRSEPRRTPDETGILLRALLENVPDVPMEIAGACFASVVPPLTGTLIEAVRRYLRVPVHEFRFTPELGIRLEVDEPEQVGADRVVLGSDWPFVAWQPSPVAWVQGLASLTQDEKNKILWQNLEALLGL